MTKLMKLKYKVSVTLFGNGGHNGKEIYLNEQCLWTGEEGNASKALLYHMF